jgi:hypothetical protein
LTLFVQLPARSPRPGPFLLDVIADLVVAGMARALVDLADRQGGGLQLGEGLIVRSGSPFGVGALVRVALGREALSF